MSPALSIYILREGGRNLEAWARKIRPRGTLHFRAHCTPYHSASPSPSYPLDISFLSHVPVSPYYTVIIYHLLLSIYIVIYY
jgi:hypothetical protein